MEGEGWRVSDEEAEIWEIIQFGSSGSGQVIISSSNLFWPCWLPSKTEQRPLVWGNKEWLYWQKTGVTHCFFLCSVCVFSITKKYPGAPGILRQQWLPQVAGCSPRVNTGCECDMSGQTCSWPECYSVRAAKVWGHRLLVGPRSLKGPQRTGH